jgi:hypothetical protein
MLVASLGGGILEESFTPQWYCILKKDILRHVHVKKVEMGKTGSMRGGEEECT